MAKYKFTVDYIHNSFIEAHPAMHPSHPDFIKAMSSTVIDVEYGVEIPLEQAQQNVVAALEGDNCKVMRIDGARVE